MDFSKLASPKIKNLYYGSLDDGSKMNKILEVFRATDASSSFVGPGGIGSNT